MKKPFNIMQHYHYVPSERKRGLDALSDSERPYYRHSNNSFCQGSRNKSLHMFRVYGFEVDEFVQFKNRPFIGRFEG